MSELYAETVPGSHADPELIELREQLIDSRLRSAPHYRLPVQSKWLRALLRPLPVGKFESEYWGTRFWHGRTRTPRRFAQVFSLDRLGEMIAQRAIPLSLMQLVDASQSRLSAARVAQLSADEIIRHLFCDSGSIVINQLERLEPGVAETVRELETATGMRCQTNMYFTSAGAQTAVWHWDSHDVFLLQIHGEKAWKIYEREVDTPLLTSHHETSWPLRSEGRARLVSELTMRPGDVLYIPAGVPHQACASSEQHSLHLTLGLHGVSWHDLVETVIKRALVECEQDLAFRRLVPVEPGQAAVLQRPRHLRRLLGEVLRRADPSVAESMLMMKAPEATLHTAEAMTRLWAVMSDGSWIRPTTVVSRTRTSFALTRTALLVHLEVNGKKLSFEPRFFTALRWIQSKTSFPVDSIPGPLSPQERLELCTTLVSRGLLVPQQPRKRTPLRRAR